MDNEAPKSFKRDGGKRAWYDVVPIPHLTVKSKYNKGSYTLRFFRKSLNFKAAKYR